ncbi:hypothetical protein JCGZ_01540 [Jatropha curcas]|uniref:Squalene monooxygenase n=1 Tax=Jatropha curcas TaxID=180498 RepID=A0A067LK23_JATCU|nr:hypothetical protein JCGZ_01540 [Jatropha curcas]
MFVNADFVEKIDAQQVFGYAIYKDGKSTKLSYPLQSFESNIAGRTFNNGRFIQRMREKAATLPSVSLEQGTVTSLIEENGTVKGLLYPMASAINTLGGALYKVFPASTNRARNEMRDKHFLTICEVYFQMNQ